MRFFGKLSRRQRAVKIACVATLAQVMRQMKKLQKKIARNSMSRIFCDKISVFVRGWLHLRFSPRAGDATISKKSHHHRKQKIARVAAALKGSESYAIKRDSGSTNWELWYHMDLMTMMISMRRTKRREWARAYDNVTLFCYFQNSSQLYERGQTITLEFSVTVSKQQLVQWQLYSCTRVTLAIQQFKSVTR